LPGPWLAQPPGLSPTRAVPDDHQHFVPVRRYCRRRAGAHPREQLTLAGFLAGYMGLTREAYALDLRQYANWSQQRHLCLFQARRADIECFARDLEARGRALRHAFMALRICGG
jgi:hypothetical protein